MLLIEKKKLEREKSMWRRATPNEQASRCCYMHCNAHELSMEIFVK